MTQIRTCIFNDLTFEVYIQHNGKKYFDPIFFDQDEKDAWLESKEFEFLETTLDDETIMITRHKEIFPISFLPSAITFKDIRNNEEIGLTMIGTLDESPEEFSDEESEQSEVAPWDSTTIDIPGAHNILNRICKTVIAHDLLQQRVERMENRLRALAE